MRLGLQNVVKLIQHVVAVVGVAVDDVVVVVVVVGGGAEGVHFGEVGEVLIDVADVEVEVDIVVGVDWDDDLDVGCLGNRIVIGVGLLDYGVVVVMYVVMYVVVPVLMVVVDALKAVEYILDCDAQVVRQKC